MAVRIAGTPEGTVEGDTEIEFRIAGLVSIVISAETEPRDTLSFPLPNSASLLVVKNFCKPWFSAPPKIWSAIPSPLESKE